MNMTPDKKYVENKSVYDIIKHMNSKLQRKDGFDFFDGSKYIEFDKMMEGYDDNKDEPDVDPFDSLKELEALESSTNGEYDTQDEVDTEEYDIQEDEPDTKEYDTQDEVDKEYYDLIKEYDFLNYDPNSEYDLEDYNLTDVYNLEDLNQTNEYDLEK